MQLLVVYSADDPFPAAFATLRTLKSRAFYTKIGGITRKKWKEDSSEKQPSRRMYQSMFTLLAFLTDAIIRFVVELLFTSHAWR